MEPNWQVKKLGEVAECQDGDWILSKDLATGNDVRLIQLGDIGEGKFLDKTSKYISRERCKELKCTLLEVEDILLARLGEPLGKACIFPNLPYPCITAVDVTIIRPKSSIDRDFLHLYLNSSAFREKVNSIATGATRKRISRKNLENLEIPVPGIEEQRRIVKKLEKILVKIEEARIFRQESIKESGILLKSAIYNYFSKTTANKEKLRDVAVLERGKFTPRPRNDPRYFGGNIPWIQIGDITNKQGKYINSYSGTLNEEGLAVSRMFSAGTVVTSIAASIGTTGILGFDSAFPDSLIGIQGKEVLNDYVYYYLQFMQSHLDYMAPQSAQKNINLRILGDLEIPVPDLNEQEKIVAYLDGLSEKVQALLKLQQEQLQDLEALKQSVLHQAFQGKL